MSHIPKIENKRGHYWSEPSRLKLADVHPDLVLVVTKCLYQISPVDLSILTGVRTIDEQQCKFDEGSSRTLNSRHLKRPMHYKKKLGYYAAAIDVGVWIPALQGTSEDPKDYIKLNDYMQEAAEELGLDPLDWGGNFVSLFDGYHFQLNWKRYPVVS